MIGVSSRRFLLMLCGLATLTAVGCADLELPNWVPFQGPASDKLAGVVPPSERIEKLKKLRKKPPPPRPSSGNGFRSNWRLRFGRKETR